VTESEAVNWMLCFVAMVRDTDEFLFGLNNEEEHGKKLDASSSNIDAARWEGFDGLKGGIERKAQVTEQNSLVEGQRIAWDPSASSNLLKVRSPYSLPAANADDPTNSFTTAMTAENLPNDLFNNGRSISEAASSVTATL